jgi:hypothetical protein
VVAKRLPTAILRTSLLAALIAGLVAVTVSPNSATAQATHLEEVGTLPIRGTMYRIRVPTKWNGTLINDLDFANGADAGRYLYLLDQGYAVSETARRSDRSTNCDHAHEIHDLITVLDIFEASFGKPSRTLQYGHSGGVTSRSQCRRFIPTESMEQLQGAHIHQFGS